MSTDTIQFHQRWWTYQHERFPILSHGLLIAAFSASAVSYSALQRGPESMPTVATLIIAFITSFLFFLQLRIADEFKDYEEDKRYRPYRPVPRGLISLSELGLLGIATMGAQLLLAAWLKPSLLGLLLLAWGYFALMSKEFFVAKWLKAHPVIYMLSHMLIMPMIDLYVTACDWMLYGSIQNAPHFELIWFLGISFMNGLIIEIGRKIRAPEDEETGVETYSVLWGQRNATWIWLGIILLTAGGTIGTAMQIDFVRPIAILLLILLSIGAWIGQQFLAAPNQIHAKRIEQFSGIWTLCIYLFLGPIPLLVG